VNEKQLRKKRDQELIEILNEVRVALAGASVLFGFLLVVPFSAGWEAASNGQKGAYAAAFGATVLSVIGLMLPTAYHRVRRRERNTERMLRVSHLGAVSGIAFLAVAMSAATGLVMDEISSSTISTVATVGVAAAFAAVWFALPLSSPYDRWDDDEPDDVLDEHGMEPDAVSRVD
jgi:hypothetical protein